MPQWIEIRKEVREMLYGSRGEPPQGRWVVMYWFDPTKPSKYFNPVTEEAIGGPAYKYLKYALRTSSDVGNLFLRVESGTIAKGPAPGTFDMGSELYIIEHCYNPKIGDWIVEYDCEYPDNVEAFMEMTKTTAGVKWTIKSVRPIRVDGKIVYYLALAQVDQKRQ